MISLWLWPLLALGADIESPEPRMPDPRTPTLFEIEGEYKKIAQIYGRNYCISRIFVLASKLKKHIEATIEDPIQQNLRWRYIKFLVDTSRPTPRDRDDPFLDHPTKGHLADIRGRFLKNQPDWFPEVIQVLSGLIWAINEYEHWQNTDKPEIAVSIKEDGVCILKCIKEDTQWVVDVNNSGKVLLSAPGQFTPHIWLPPIPVHLDRSGPDLPRYVIRTLKVMREFLKPPVLGARPRTLINILVYKNPDDIFRLRDDWEAFYRPYRMLSLFRINHWKQLNAKEFGELSIDPKDIIIPSIQILAGENRSFVVEEP
jgi:hypothetical protein